MNALILAQLFISITYMFMYIYIILEKETHSQ